MTMSSPIHEALKAHALSSVSQTERYGHFLAIFRRILGAEPNLSKLTHLSPLTQNFFFGAMRSCFRMPWCDFGLSSLSPRQRALAMLESSMAHGCSYCIAHCAVLGDVVRGTLVDRCVQDGGLICGRGEDTADSVLKQLVREVCGVPGSLSEDTRKRFIAVFGESGMTDITAILAFIAWLNATMDATEVRLESKLAPFAELVLRQKNVNVDFGNVLADDGEEALGEEEVRMVTGSQISTISSRLTAWTQNIRDIVGLGPAMWKAMMWERSCFEGIPSDVVQLDKWVLQELKCVPNGFQQISDGVVKRAYALGLREVFVKEGNTHWSGFEKVAFMFVFAKCLQNQLLEDDAVRIAEAMETGKDGRMDGAESSQTDSTNAQNGEMSMVSTTVAKRLESVYLNVCSADEPRDGFSAAAKYVFACAGRADQVPEEVKSWLLEFVTEPGRIVDVGGMIGLCSFMHRVSILVPSS